MDNKQIFHCRNCDQAYCGSCPPCFKYICDLQDELALLWNQRVDNIALIYNGITKPLGEITE